MPLFLSYADNLHDTFSEWQNGQCTQGRNTSKALNTQKIININIILESLPKYYLVLGMRTLVKRLLILRIYLLYFIFKNFFPFFCTYNKDCNACNLPFRCGSRTNNILYGSSVEKQTFLTWYPSSEPNLYMLSFVYQIKIDGLAF